MQKIQIDNRDTDNIHIDTYQMLTGEGADESTIDYERDERKDDSLTYDSFDWTYDHKQIVKAFALESISILENNVDKDIISSITLESTSSPRFYNYTTDGYVMNVTYNLVKLNEYVTANYKAIKEKADGYSDSNVDANMLHAGICHLFDNCMSKDDYNMSIWEVESEVYMNNTTYELLKKAS